MADNIERTDDTDRTRTRTNATASRRRFMQTAAGAGALAVGLGGGAVGSAAADHDDRSPSRLERDGNLIVDADGEEVELHGVAIADPKRIDVTERARGKTVDQIIELATDAEQGWHANVIRLPIKATDVVEYPDSDSPEPVAFDEAQVRSYVEDHLDGAVQKCADEGVYALISYHRDTNRPWTDGPLSEETELLWDVVAERYADQDHVVFEPFHTPRGNSNYGVSGQALVDWWSDWLDTAQPWVDTIRSHTDNLTIMGSPRYSQATFGAVIEEFDAENVGYSLHVYPAHGPTTPEDYDDFLVPVNYDGDGVSYDDETPAYDVAPVVLTSWGFDPDAPAAVGGAITREAAREANWAEHDPDYGTHVTEWLSTRPVHSTARNFDPIWAPRMFERDFEGEGFDNPYDPEQEVPNLVSDLPAEWNLLGGEYMGETIKEFLASGSESAGGETTDESTPEPSGPAGDLDDDGLVEDVDDDGDQDIDDMRAFADQFESEEIQSNPGQYDYNGDGDVDEYDILEFYHELFRNN
ncbi:glycoside hydrolase family 5 protein [Halomicrobium salinisoli]|uniref:glycoside hydrolase family 5 protein n=1 Tax=Halomicrobium salinisoli TaxID=2878391 RepID=UPI001CF08A35|nr:cellulase family glycosylhydrolase [Halomicrobium salinisoli]